MRRVVQTIFFGAALLSCTGNYKGASLVDEIGTMPSFESGYEQGVSACYAAIFNDTLYIAGGCNFPGIPAANGGKKHYYKGIYKAAICDTLQWQQSGVLLTSSAYGATVQTGNQWIIAGGINNDGAYTAVYSINLANNCSIDTLPSLPLSIDNGAAAAINNCIYIVGGNVDGKPSNRVFTLDLRKRAEGWKEIASMPSRNRVQPVCAATAEALYIWGGFTPADSTGPATTHCDGVRYIFDTGKWEKLNNISVNEISFTLSGGTAALLDSCTIIAAGGVDKDIFTDAISGTYSLTSKEEYMLHPAEWYRFNQRLVTYDTKNCKWELLMDDNVFARAGAIMLPYNNSVIYIGGELKPGIRTPRIHIAKTDNTKQR